MQRVQQQNNRTMGIFYITLSLYNRLEYGKISTGWDLHEVSANDHHTDKQKNWDNSQNYFILSQQSLLYKITYITYDTAS